MASHIVQDIKEKMLYLNLVQIDIKTKWLPN